MEVSIFDAQKMGKTLFSWREILDTKIIGN